MSKQFYRHGILQLVIFLGPLGLCSTSALALAQNPVDLKAAFESALQKTEALPLAQTEVERSAEKLSQAKGSLLPKVTATGSYLRQDQVAATGSSRAVTKADQSSAKLTLSQPLFQGFKEFAGLRLASDRYQAQQALALYQKLELYGLVAASYFNVLAAERDLEDIGSLQTLTEERVKELRNRAKVGRSRNGDLLTAMAQVSTLKAQMEAARNQILQARSQLALVTGLAQDSALVKELGPLPEKVSPLEEHLKMVAERPDIVALKVQLEAAKESVVVARAGHYPTLDFTGNYYLKRSGVLEDSKWDAGLSATIPLFAGGVIQSQVREAALDVVERELLLRQSQRRAEEGVRSAYYNLISGLSQIRSFEEALKIAEQNYKEQNHDYRFGLATNLDVLQALNNLNENKRSLDRLFYQTHGALVTLSTATGRGP